MGGGGIRVLKKINWGLKLRRLNRGFWDMLEFGCYESKAVMNRQSREEGGADGIAVVGRVEEQRRPDGVGAAAAFGGGC